MRLDESHELLVLGDIMLLPFESRRVGIPVDAAGQQLGLLLLAGQHVLLIGPPGTAKSTLSGLFAAAACERGDRTLYVSFDEGASQIVRNLRFVDAVQLRPVIDSIHPYADAPAAYRRLESGQAFGKVIIANEEA